MRKYFEGLSPAGVALIFVSIAFGTFLRLYDIDLVSYWSDELATIYFTKYPLKIYSEETHPFGFYLLLKPFLHIFGPDVYVMRFVTGLLSVGFNLYLVHYARSIFPRNGWVIFTILFFMMPVDIAFARMARMYSLIFSLSTWFYLLMMKEPKSWKLPLASFLMSIVFPVGFLPGLFYGIFLIAKERSFSKSALRIFGSIAPMCLYYLSKFIFVKSNPFTDYLGGDNKVRPLLIDFLYAMGGEYFPKNAFISMPGSVFWLMLFLTITAFLIGVFYRVKEKKWIYGFDFSLSFFVFSIIFFKLFGLLAVNIEVGRYLIFLVPLIIIQFAALGLEKWRDFPAIMLLGFMLYALLNYSPLAVYEGEREAFNYYEELKKLHPGKVAICGNKFQYDFYFNQPHIHCSEVIKNYIESKEEFVFMDINGYGRHLIPSLMKTHDMLEYKNIYFSIMALARPIKSGDK